MLDTETSTEVDSDGLTKKQKEMSRARNPMNGNMLSEFSMDDKGASATPPAKPAGVTTDPNRSKVRTGGAQTQQPVVQIQKTLGSFSTRLQGKANEFLSGASGAQATSIGQGAVKFDPNALEGGGAYVATEGQGRADTSALETDKLAQLQDLRMTAQDFYTTDANGKTQAPKSFSDTLKKFADSNGDGQIDDEEQQLLNMSTQIATKIQQLDALGEQDTAEARALRAELQMYDQNGLVSGILQAKRQYESLFGGGKDKYGNKTEGLKYSGDKGDEGVSITDLLALDEQRVKDEVGKAVKSASGLFGGDFESNLVRKIDRDTASYKASQQERANVLNEFTSAAEVYVGDYETKFKAQAGQFASAFRNGAAAFAANPNISQNAKDWMANLADKPDQDISAAMLDVLQGKDSGLADDERKLLASYIGDLPGMNVNEKEVKLSSMMKDLATKGTFVVTDEQGNKVEYKPKVEDLAAITRIMYDKNLNEEQKNAALLDAVDDSLNDATVLDEDYAKIEKYLASGQLDKGIKTFADNVQSSLVTFDKSRTDQLFDDVASRNPRREGEDGKAYVARIGEMVLQKNKDFQNGVVEAAKKFDDTLLNTTKEIEKGAQGIAAALGVTPAEVMDEGKLTLAVQQFQQSKFENAVNEGMLKLKTDLDNTQPTQQFAATIKQRSKLSFDMLEEVVNNELVPRTFMGGYGGVKPDRAMLVSSTSLKDYFDKFALQVLKSTGSRANPDKIIAALDPDRKAQIESYFANRSYSALTDPMFDLDPKLKGGVVANAAASILTTFDDIGPDLKNKGPMYKMIQAKLNPSQRAALDKYIANPKAVVPKQTYQSGGQGWTAVTTGMRSDRTQALQLVDVGNALKTILGDTNNLKLAYQSSFTPLAESFREQGRQLLTAAAGVRSAGADMARQKEQVAQLVKQAQTSTFTQLDVVNAAREKLVGGVNFGGPVASEKNTLAQIAGAQTSSASRFQASDPVSFAKLQGQVKDAAAKQTSTSTGKYSRTGNLIDTLRG